MNNIERIFAETEDIRKYAGNYLGYLAEVLKRLDTEAIARFAEELEEARKNQNTVFFTGNGGSAATATHMANDFGIGSRIEDGTKPYRVLALTDNVSKMTAISNDFGYDEIFVRQLKIHYRPGDKLVVISASGNSSNLVAAAKWVKEQGGTVIGLLGFDGGKLKELCDVAVHVVTPKGEYGPVEDAHLILGHLVSTWLFQKRREAKPV